jgi:serine/threonine-protein kinase
MGLVFRAWDQRLHREVAIKIVRDSYRVPGMQERFLQEARATSRLNHPNICTIFDIGAQEGDPYLVMELLEGETLKQRISRGSISTDELVIYAREVADALAAAHAKNIIHRDIKPANIFLVKTPAGNSQAKVLDFGLAKINRRINPTPVAPVDNEKHIHPDESSLNLTVEGVTVGTVSYMSPEQARGHALDPRSDLFSLGIVMYEMATRRTPFRGTNSAQVFSQILDHDPEPVHNWNESIPRDLERIILKLLSKDRRQRYQNAAELSIALEKLNGRMSKGSSWLRKPSPPPVVPIVPTFEPVARERRRSRRDSSSSRTITPKNVRSGSTVIRPFRTQSLEPAAMRPWPTAASVLTAGSSTGFEGTPSNSSFESAPVLTGSGIHQFEFSAEEMAPDPAATLLQQHVVKPSLRQWTLRIGAAAVALAIVAGAIITLRGGHLSSASLGPKDVLLLTSIQDKTGEKLGSAVLEGLALSLAQTRSFTVRADSAYLAGIRQLAQKQNGGTANPSSRAVAQKVGAKAYLFGEMTHLHNGGEHSPYVIRIDALKAETNDRLVTLTEEAASRAEIPAAIDRLSRSLRSELGEDEGSLSNLSQQATADIDALKAYSDGETAVHSSRMLDAISSFRSAVQYDPQFAQAHLELAWLYNTQHAEIAAAEAARLAQTTAKSGNQRIRVLSEFTYEMIVSGDYGRASTTIRQFNDQFPNDPEGMLGLSRVLRAQGHLVESLLAAQQSYENDPFRGGAYVEAELDMIGLNRFLDALKLEQQAAALGVLPGRAGIPASYLANRTDLLDQQKHALEDQSTAHRSPTPGELAAFALALDNSGQWDEGEQLWTRAAATASTIPGLQSAGAYLLNQAALNRAIAGRCSEALDLLRMNSITSRGPTAAFRGGMSSALCGHADDTQQAIASLEGLRSNGLPVTHYGPFELRAALAIHGNDSDEALHLLDEVEAQNDPSLLPYLRSLAYSSAGDSQQAADNLRAIMDHQGAVYLSGVSVYPVATLQLAHTETRQQLAMTR